MDLQHLSQQLEAIENYLTQSQGFFWCEILYIFTFQKKSYNLTWVKYKVL